MRCDAPDPALFQPLAGRHLLAVGLNALCAFASDQAGDPERVLPPPFRHRLPRHHISRLSEEARPRSRDGARDVTRARPLS